MTCLPRINVLSITIALLTAILNSPCAQAQSKFTVIHNFGAGTDGANPYAALVTDKSGALYGTTVVGGRHSKGTVFKMTPPRHGKAWTETVLHNFAAGSDGSLPAASLLLDNVGNLYGTTQTGGAASVGVAFKLTPGQGGHWSETVLHSFGARQDDALVPENALIMDKAGSLYGTGLGGVFGFGAVFKLTHKAGRWTENTLHSFDEGVDGYIPHGLAMDKTGSLYGAMQVGGAPGSQGLVFTLTPTTGGNWTEHTIHTFPGSPDGRGPRSSLLLLPNGTLYGTTSSGGDFDEGIVYNLKPAGDGTWTETVLYSFKSGNDGRFPQGNLVADRTGALYGTTYAGGDFSQGIVFKLTPQTDGTYIETVLHNFTGGSDGGSPLGGLVFDNSGALYGITNVGGQSNLGVVFQLK